MLGKHAPTELKLQSEHYKSFSRAMHTLFSLACMLYLLCISMTLLVIALSFGQSLKLLHGLELQRSMANHHFTAGGKETFFPKALIS